MTRTPLAWPTLLALSLAGAACTDRLQGPKETGNASSPTRGGTLQLASFGDIRSLDPATASDARLKKDVQPLGGALDRLLALRSVSFEYKDPAAIHELPGRQVGFIAQEVEKVFPTWVSERADGMKCVAPKGFESLTVAALRELRDEKDGQIAKLAAENETLRARLADQDARIAAIEKALAGAAAGSVAPAAAQDR